MSSNLIFISPTIITGRPVVGQAYEGGFYVGQMIDSGQLYDIIISPKAQGQIQSLRYKTAATSDGQLAASVYDGWTNTNALADAEHPLFEWARSQVINGFDDWYIPARDELELLLRTLKPTTAGNNNGTRTAQAGEVNPRIGQNANSFPVGGAYASNVPALTKVVGFQAHEAQTLYATSAITTHYSSTQSSIGEGQCWIQSTTGLIQQVINKNTSGAARLIRRVLVGPTP